MNSKNAGSQDQLASFIFVWVKLPQMAFLFKVEKENSSGLRYKDFGSKHLTAGEHHSR
jgi:hypothetical protein